MSIRALQKGDGGAVWEDRIQRTWSLEEVQGGVLQEEGIQGGVLEKGILDPDQIVFQKAQGKGSF